MQFQHVDRDQKGEFFLNNAEGQRIAEIRYLWRDETTIDANHTWVDDSLRGQGVARLLLDTLVDFSREKNLKIIPTCSYVDVMFHHHSAMQNIKFEEKAEQKEVQIIPRWGYESDYSNQSVFSFSTE